MLEKIIVQNAIEKIMSEEIEINQLFFLVKDIGFLSVEEISLYDGEISLHNCEIDIERRFLFNEEIYLLSEQEEE